MTFKITLIEGDGIGPEVIRSAQEVLLALDNGFLFETKLLGQKAIEKFGVSLPDDTLESIKKNKVALKGPTTTPIGEGHKSANVELRKALDLYACIRPVKSLLGVETRFKNVDLVIFRENTEGLYAGHEIKITDEIVISLRTTSKKASDRIAYKAFSFGEKYHKKNLCAAHKANILKIADGLFLNCIRFAAQKFPYIKYEEYIIDALCMKLVTSPETFGILLLENMFGDIVSDLAAGLVGGLGVVPGANIGDEYAVFEAVHGSAPDIAGLNIANPIGILQSSIMMLNHLNKADLAQKLQSAIENVLVEKKVRTKDLGGNAKTDEFTKHLISFL